MPSQCHPKNSPSKRGETTPNPPLKGDNPPLKGDNPPNPPLEGGDKNEYVSPEDVVRILEDLGCQLEVKEENPLIWLVTVPPYRYRDLEREIDLIEEVARLYGYDHFYDTLPTQSQTGYIPSSWQIQRQIRNSLTGLGLTELVQYSLVSPEKAEIKIANPLFSEYSALRTNLIDGLITAFEYNQAQGNGALNAFEIGRVFWSKDGNVCTK